MDQPTKITAEEAISSLGTIVLGEDDLTGVMDTVVRLALDTIPSADDVSLTLLKNGRATTAAFTSARAVEVDERQYEEGYGPCLDAAVSGEMMAIEDTSAEVTYPEVARLAADLGVRSTLSVPLPVRQATLGAVNIYTSGTSGFGARDRQVAATFAAAAAIALANAALYEETAALAGQMREALQTRAVIDQAKGILMRDNRCTADEAFGMLVQASNRSNRKLRDMAQALVDGVARGA